MAIVLRLKKDHSAALRICKQQALMLVIVSIGRQLATVLLRQFALVNLNSMELPTRATVLNLRI